MHWCHQIHTRRPIAHPIDQHDLMAKIEGSAEPNAAVVVLRTVAGDGAQRDRRLGQARGHHVVVRSPFAQSMELPHTQPDEERRHHDGSTQEDDVATWH